MSSSRYGSDENGLVWAYLFVPGEPARVVDGPRAAEVLDAPPTGDEFLWLHFSLANTNTARWLAQNARLPDSFRDSLAGGGGSTRVELVDDALVAVFRDVLFDFTFDPENVSTVVLGVRRNLLVSARLKPLRSVERLRNAAKRGEVFTSSIDLLAHLLRDQAQVLSEIVQEATNRVDGIEDNLLADRITSNRAELGSLRRVLVRLSRLLAPEPAALFRLLQRPPRWIGEEDHQSLRQAAEEFAAATADAQALVERVRLVQEEIAATANEQINRTLFVLTVVTVLALPINLVAGLFGMNVGGVPFGADPGGFGYVLAFVVLLTLVLAALARWVARAG